MRKLLIGLLFAFLLTPFGTNDAKASEGTAELYNRIGESARCFIASVLMPDYQYKILVSCRDLIYPSEPDVFKYVMWATPVEGNKPFTLGELGVGKVEFKTKTAFSELFVTKEKTVRSTNILSRQGPSSPTVMSGSIRRISFLDGEYTPEKTEPIELTPTPTPAAQKTNTFMSRLKIILPILFVAAFITMLILYLVNRFRK